MFLLLACAAPSEPPPDPERTPTGDSSAPPDATAATGETGETGDTAAPPPPPEGLYPPAPYDCATGVPAGPFDATLIDGVKTTEDFAFDLDGYLVASDWSTNLIRWQPDATRDVWVPDAAETRGIDLLPDGDLVVTDALVGLIVRVARATGAMTVVGSLGSSPSGIDVDAAGTVYAGDLAGGHSWMLDAAGTLTDLGEPVPGQFVQTYGAALSPDEQTLYVTQYNGGWVFRYLRDGLGWTLAERWVELPGQNLAGVVTDVCGNLYVVESTGCEIFRVSPAGVSERIAKVDVAGQYCPSLAFGRGLGGWDAYTLYVSTYDEVAQIQVGVPGRPR